ncbi:MAG: sensor histidine kinase [Saprospiraceae bacterium]|nr:sensor histidine kinase [Saprospiraceae bacterium]
MGTNTFPHRQRKLLMHIGFWCVYASFFFYRISYSRGGEDPDWDRILKDVSFQVIAMIVISYINYFFFLPRLFKNRNLGRYLIEFIPVLLLLAYLVVLGKRAILDDDSWMQKVVYSDRFMIIVMLNTFFLVIFVGLLRFVENWFEMEARKKEFENEKLTSELRFLKAQINPHFLFNTLNNLYYLAFNQSPNTTEVIAKLSTMMRYMLYDSNHARVPLDKEIEYIENYISLEKLRLNEEVPITVEVKGNTAGVTIVPLVLITFLENAFKHGVSNSSKGSWINVTLDVQQGICHYTVANSKIAESGKTVTESSGIGLQNVKRRLDLSYPDSYQLEVKEDENAYFVDLKLNLV